MADSERRPLTEEVRARIQAARNRGGLCGLCGRDLVEGEAVWMERIDVHATGRNLWQAPVGAECVSPETVRATCTMQPTTCAACGRPFYPSLDVARRPACCSKRCTVRVALARRAKKGPRS